MKPSARTINEQIGLNIAHKRVMKGIGRAEFGKALSTPISYQAVTKYEEGKIRIPAASLVEIAGILDCSVTDFLKGVEKLIPNGNGSRQAETMFRRFNSIESKDVQEAISNLTRAISLELANKYRVKK